MKAARVPAAMVPAMICRPAIQTAARVETDTARVMAGCRKSIMRRAARLFATRFLLTPAKRSSS